ncbi:after-VIT domain-containing protein [Pseudanabaena sp. UWO311]|uniref:after-VIT domain-containing protein n=1 Tax=Pseudanabaena sp. UWO311 TaxID=2487337 RepID=UPI001159452A|nr:after-VIT domain-containing protein [Pseudanabaena sp. UWO311]TYQ28946.1 after-VIT domain-containing protein [Pseudanabaena sp. UWO311]
MSYSHSESNTLSRRYELPTCLLEIWTERSPLSDWQSQTVAQNLSFRLQLAQGKKIIKGNQQQIVNLIEVVTAYCDRWLTQDDFGSLDHAIAVPQLPKLQLSTLQLFDLYESLELCTNEFVILPNIVLEVRRLNPNWLKIVAGAIAIVGISIGTIRLISPPFGEQPSYQIASTPSASDPEKASIPPVSFDNNVEGRAKVDASPKSTNPISLSPKPSLSEEKSNVAKAPAASRLSQSPQTINSDRKALDQPNKVAISPESGIADSINSSSQRATDNVPSITGAIKPSSPATRPRQLETPKIGSSAQPTTIAGESAPSSTAPSEPLSIPSAESHVNSNNAVTNIKVNIKVLQIQSELPSDITSDLVRYIQTQRINTSTTGTLTLELAISGDRISNISTDNQGSTLKDTNTISEVEKSISEWRSPNSTNGKIRLVLQLSP